MRADRILPAAVALVTVLAAACAANPEPGEAGYPYNVDGQYAGRLTVGGVEFEAVIRMDTAPGGVVSGSLGAARLERAADRPSGSVEGDFSGTLQGDVLVWRSSWVEPTTGCSGVLRGRGPVEEGGAALEGEVRIAGDCVDSAGGSYRLTR